MTQPIAGWYTDPAGDTTKLRYWDGTKWTDSLMDAPAPQSSTMPNATSELTSSETSPQSQTASAMAEESPAASAVPAEATAAVTEAQAQPTQSAQVPTATAYDAAYQQPAGQTAYAEAQPSQSTQSTAAPAQNVVSQDTYAPIYVNYGDMPLYYVSPQDTTLRLVAFILALISTITMGFAVIPLAWMIPMTVMTWQIYKGKRANTVGFDVCSLIFLNLVSGILLLVSTKEE